MDKLIFYGAASIGKIALDVMKDFKICGFIDKRAFEIKEYCGYPVWDKSSVPKEIKRTAVVFVAVKNVFEHEKIVENLVNEGFKKIIYKPMNVILGMGSKEEKEVSELYDSLFGGSLKELPDIPDAEILHGSIERDYALIKEEENFVIANVPIECVFTNDYPKSSPMSKWGNIPILGFFTHIDFFKSLDGDKEADYNSYLKEYVEFTAKIQNTIQLTDSWKENAINSRIQIFEQMSKAYELDPDFFVRNVITAIWNNERKYFNLASGKHRATFMATKGKRYIPLKISSEDYKAFLNQNCIEKRRSLFEKIKKEEIAIEHPYFYRTFSGNSSSDYKFIAWFMEFFAKETFKKNDRVAFDTLNILYGLVDAGYILRAIKKAGGNISRLYESDEIEDAIDELFYVEGLPKDNSNSVCYDIVILEEYNFKEFMLSNRAKPKYLLLHNVSGDIEEKGLIDTGFKEIILINSKTIGLKVVRNYCIRLY